MKLSQFANKVGRAECAVAMGISRGNLRQLIYRERDVEQLKDGRWILISEKCKIFDV